jgi:CBS domain-containing protein
MMVREILHAHIPYLTQHSTLRDAIDKMDIYQFPALVLVDNTFKPTGILSENEVYNLVKTQGSVLKIGNWMAYDWAIPNPICISPDATIEEALERMFDFDLILMPVVEDEKLLGIVLRMDLLQAQFIAQ